METAVITSLIAGVFSLVTALSSVWLTHYLEGRPRVVASASARTAAPRMPGSTPHRRPLAASPLVRACLVIVVGFGLGATSSAVRNQFTGHIHYEAVASLAVLVLITLAMAFRRPARSIWLYELGVISLWAAFLSGLFFFVDRTVWRIEAGGFGQWWLCCAVVGGIVVAIRARRAA